MNYLFLHCSSKLYYKPNLPTKISHLEYSKCVRKEVDHELKMLSVLSKMTYQYFGSVATID